VSVRDALARHWPLKLAALALSVILWVVVTLEKSDTRLVGIRLDLALAPGVAAAQPLPTLRAIVAGSRRELIKLSGPLTIHVAIRDSGIGAHRRLAISPSDVRIPDNVKVSVQEIEPREIEVVLDRRMQKTVAVRAVVEPESGYALDGPVRVTPSVVRVSGARSLLLLLDSLPTAPLDLKDVEGTFQRVVPLDTTGRAVLHMEPPTVTLSGRIKKT
jgi:hypothetical protein